MLGCRNRKKHPENRPENGWTGGRNGCWSGPETTCRFTGNDLSFYRKRCVVWGNDLSLGSSSSCWRVGAWTEMTDVCAARGGACGRLRWREKSQIAYNILMNLKDWVVKLENGSKGIRLWLLFEWKVAVFKEKKESLNGKLLCLRKWKRKAEEGADWLWYHVENEERKEEMWNCFLYSVFEFYYIAHYIYIQIWNNKQTKRKGKWSWSGSWSGRGLVRAMMVVVMEERGGTFTAQEEHLTTWSIF